MQFFIATIVCLCAVITGVVSILDSRFESTFGGTDGRIFNAIQNGDIQQLEQLIENGVSINAKNNDKWTPLIAAAYSDQSAVKSQMIEMLLRNGADIEAKTKFGYSSLHVAVQQNHERIVRQLVNHGADLNTQNNDGWTPLITAVTKSFYGMVELLLKNGADVNRKSNYGYSPLHVAVQGDERIVSLLMRNGADVTSKNANGQTATDIATASGNTKIVELLHSNVIRSAQKACESYSHRIDNRILGGEDADIKEFPWMVALGFINANNNYKVSFDCGGTIISELFILTAAHCVKERQPVIIRLGKSTLDDDDGVRSINHQIKEIISHPDHSILSKRNDIALIRLTKNITFSNNIAAACLETNAHDHDSSVRLIVTGWGSTSAKQMIRSNQLRKTELMTIPMHECNNTFWNYNQRVNLAAFRHGIFEGQYCAYDPFNQSDSCQGDSGGPLIHYFSDENSSVAIVVGVVSFGISCGTMLPGIYTRVAYYLDWIESIVRPNL